MDILQQLGVALGLASLAGLNLYLTVLVAGVAIRLDILHLADRYHNLEVLGHPAVLIVAGLFFLMQFFADKIPWVDTLWDSVHTFIRPVGGTLLALQSLGEVPSWLKVVAAIMAGGASLTTHSAKAGTRLLINHSPEPVSNVIMSITEEIAVIAGTIFTLLKPVLALIVFSSIIVLIWLIFPRVWRIIRTTLWLAWHKLKMPGRRVPLDKPVPLAHDLPDEVRDILRYKVGLSEADIAWTIPCLSGKGKGVRGLSPNLAGILIAPKRPDCLYFAAGKGLRERLFKVPLDGVEVEIESRFLSENLTLAASALRAVFRFPRGHADVAETVALRLREMRHIPVSIAPAEDAPSSPESIHHEEIEVISIPHSPPSELVVPEQPKNGEKLLPFPAVS